MDERSEVEMTEALAEQRLVSGREVARRVEEETAAGAAALGERGIAPTLAIVHLGDHADAASYRRSIAVRAERTNIRLQTISLPEENADHHLRAVLSKLNRDPAVHGVLVQNPLPFPLRQLVGNLLSADKDVEGQTALNLGRLALDEPAVLPCTPAAILAVIDHLLPTVRGRRVVVVNGSTTIGRPLTQILLAREATVTVCGIATTNLTAETRQAEVLVVAIGRPRAIGADHVSEGALVIDVGINVDPAGDGVCGDVDTMAVLPKVLGVTPVPGGVGPITTAILLANTVLLAERHGAVPSFAGAG